MLELRGRSRGQSQVQARRLGSFVRLVSGVTLWRRPPRGPRLIHLRLSSPLFPPNLQKPMKKQSSPSTASPGPPRRKKRKTQHRKTEKLFNDYSFRRKGDKARNGQKRRRQTPLGFVSPSAGLGIVGMDDSGPALRLANPSGIWRRRPWPRRPFVENCSR